MTIVSLQGSDWLGIYIYVALPCHPIVLCQINFHYPCIYVLHGFCTRASRVIHRGYVAYDNTQLANAQLVINHLYS